MIALFAKNLPGNHEGIANGVFRVTENPGLPIAARSKHALLLRNGNQPDSEFPLHLCLQDARTVPRSLRLPDSFDYLSEGDVLRYHSHEQAIRVLYRKKSPHNSLLVTEQCNHYCLMCSQPPRKIDDSYLVDELLDAIPLMSQDTASIGITGGEPTLLGERFLEVLRSLKYNLPAASIHVLSNGRNFTKLALCKAISDQCHRDIMFGIPIYSATPERHNFVVQATNAWDETIEGILNLKRYGIPVEIRVVLHSQTWEGLPELAEFLRRNLTMVNQVAFMGLEKMGFGSTNWNYLFVNPREYSVAIDKAVRILARARIPVFLFNLPLCMIPSHLHPFSKQSISDWKNDYPEECSSCSAKPHCCGFFSSTAEFYRKHVKPIL
jgi:His-Xaa-Ser system radical SAM maturase HxsC